MNISRSPVRCSSSRGCCGTRGRTRYPLAQLGAAFVTICIVFAWLSFQTSELLSVHKVEELDKKVAKGKIKNREFPEPGPLKWVALKRLMPMMENTPVLTDGDSDSSMHPLNRTQGISRNALPSTATRRNNKQKRPSQQLNPKPSLKPLLRNSTSMPKTLASSRRTSGITAASKTRSGIPRIIHQTWKDTSVPNKFASWVKSWKKYSPNYQYWFWTDADARKLIEKRFPDFLPIYDMYPYVIHRADAIRYFILYEFGGVYVDLDMENVRPLDAGLDTTTCVLGREPSAHTLLIHKLPDWLPSNAFMACRPRHPFFKLVIDNLPRKMTHYLADVSNSTGPHMLRRVSKKYKNVRFANDIKQPPEKIMASQVYLSPSVAFLPTFDISQLEKIKSECKNIYYLNDNQKRFCKELEMKKFNNSPHKTSFTVHHWVHMWIEGQFRPKGAPIEIQKLVADTILPRQILEKG